MQGRPKGGKNKYHSKEEKIKIVKEMLNYNLSSFDIEKKYNISHSLAGKWRKDYLEKGEESLINQKKPGNPLCKYLNKKNLTDIESLRYENMKLRIENERLKKGYLMKGDGSVVIFKK
mgnify:FL=1